MQINSIGADDVMFTNSALYTRAVFLLMQRPRLFALLDKVFKPWREESSFYHGYSSVTILVSQVSVIGM